MLWKEGVEGPEGKTASASVVFSLREDFPWVCSVCENGYIYTDVLLDVIYFSYLKKFEKPLKVFSPMKIVNVPCKICWED